jgi:hypothetical protein
MFDSSIAIITERPSYVYFPEALKIALTVCKDSFVIFDRDTRYVSLHYILMYLDFFSLSPFLIICSSAVIILSMIFAAVSYSRGNKKTWILSV